MSFCNLLGYIWQSFCLDYVNSNGYAKLYQNIPRGSRDSGSFTFFFRIRTSTKPRPIPNIIWQSHWLHLVNINVYAKFITMFFTVLEIGPFSLFSEFELRQNLVQSQMSFDNFIGYILSISICMQNYIKIFFTVQEIGSFLLFQNWELGKASTDKNVSSQSLELDLVNINVYAKLYQNIPLSSRDEPFSLFQNLALGKPSIDDKCQFTIPFG